MSKLMVIQLHYNEQNKKFIHIKREMEHELPEGDAPIIMEAYGEFLTKYWRKDFGNIHIDMNRRRAYYMGIFDPEKDYDAVVSKMQTTLVNAFIDEANRLMVVAKALKGAGL